MTSQHNTGTHPFYIGMYIHICTHIYVHIYTSQKECLCIFSQCACLRLTVRSFLHVVGSLFRKRIIRLSISFCSGQMLMLILHEHFRRVARLSSHMPGRTGLSNTCLYLKTYLGVCWTHQLLRDDLSAKRLGSTSLANSAEQH